MVKRPHLTVTRIFWLMVLVAAVQGLVLGHYVQQNHDLIGSRTRDRLVADQRLCAYVRDHVVKPDRATVSEGPRKAVPILRLLGFTNAQINAYLTAQYAKNGPVDTELARRPIPDCSAPLKGGSP